jgi:hypothetical protein
VYPENDMGSLGQGNLDQQLGLQHELDIRENVPFDICFTDTKSFGLQLTQDMALLGYSVEHFHDALTAESNIVSWEQLVNTVKAYSEYNLADWANRKTLLGYENMATLAHALGTAYAHLHPHESRNELFQGVQPSVSQVFLEKEQKHVEICSNLAWHHLPVVL